MQNNDATPVHRLNAVETPHGGGSSTQTGDALDPTALQRLRSLDPTGENKVVERVVAAFEASVTRLLPQLRDAQGAVDPGGVKHVVHTLKSSSSNVGAIKLSKMCVEIETMIRNGKGEDMSERVDALSAEIKTVLAALKRMVGHSV